ncbi:hypothetical protein [Photobacterium sanguinicancri]|uniref:hypothetical protein n=1 Tax=Photobacterium sanguinicancri TaxID=875932 RepID=UPI000B0D89D4|nr:hypothetical protein [Photobacterium sanguinicancri]
MRLSLYDFMASSTVPSNRYQITLADALWFLQHSFPEQTAELMRVADYQCRWLAK